MIRFVEKALHLYLHVSAAYFPCPLSPAPYATVKYQSVPTTTSSSEWGTTTSWHHTRKRRRQVRRVHAWHNDSDNWTSTRCKSTFFNGSASTLSARHRSPNMHSLRNDTVYYKNSSGDEIVNVNFFYDDIAHVLQNTKKNLFRLTN